MQTTPERVGPATGGGPEPVIAVTGLRMHYGPFEAVRGVDLRVTRGEVFAFLGPNGAGKTTTVEILEGYRRRTGGEVAVLGEDPPSTPARMAARIGVVLQESELERELTVAECVALYAGYYPQPRDVDEMIALVGLATTRDVAAAGSPAARSAASTSRSRSSAIPSSSSSTSPPRASTPPPDAPRGR